MATHHHNTHHDHKEQHHHHINVFHRHHDSHHHHNNLHDHHHSHSGCGLGSPRCLRPDTQGTGLQEAPPMADCAAGADSVPDSTAVRNQRCALLSKGRLVRALGHDEHGLHPRAESFALSAPLRSSQGLRALLVLEVDQGVPRAGCIRLPAKGEHRLRGRAVPVLAGHRRGRVQVLGVGHHLFARDEREDLLHPGHLPARPPGRHGLPEVLRLGGRLRPLHTGRP
mmetsp:Transcript_95468/g.204865  ORF Transcript_95468/g.204865 Transcript_95468/m.204865 type:complete len:225 (-) Transcript_95468:484-1158(-)